jgi:hypothetical protein
VPELSRLGEQVPGVRPGEDAGDGLKAGTRRWEAYQAIRAAGWYGVTFDELCATLGRTYSQTGPRVRELVTDGLVAKADFRRRATSGADQEVWFCPTVDGRS